MNTHKAKMIAGWVLSVALAAVLIGTAVSLYDSVLRYI